MKLSEVAIFTVLSSAMFFTTVGTAQADDQPVPTLYSEVCSDGSNPVTDVNGDSVCPNDQQVAVPMDDTNVVGDGTVDGAVCGSDATDPAATPVQCLIRTSVAVPMDDTNVVGDGTVDGAVCGSDATDPTATPVPCPIMYSTRGNDLTAVEKSAASASSTSNSNVLFPLVGIALVLAMSFGARKLTK